MRSRLLSWFYLLPCMARLAHRFYVAREYLEKHAIRQLPGSNPETLPASLVKRWKHYNLGAAYLQGLFCALHDYRPDNNVQDRFTSLAFLAAYFDDLTDAHPDLLASLENTKQPLEEFARQADPHGITLPVLQQLKNKYSGCAPQEFQEQLVELFHTERAYRQLSIQTEWNELQHLSGRKGACSVRLFRLLIPIPASPTEQEVWHLFGGFIQLCDDIFDLWFDHRDQIPTPAIYFAHQNDIRQLHTFFSHQLSSVQQQFRYLQLPPRQIENCLQMINFLAASTRVCLDQYLYLEKKHGTLPLKDRHMMVVDMDKWNNRFHFLWKILRQ